MEVVHSLRSVLMRPRVLGTPGWYHLAASTLALPVRAALSRAGARSVSREARTTTSYKPQRAKSTSIKAHRTSTPFSCLDERTGRRTPSMYSHEYFSGRSVTLTTPWCPRVHCAFWAWLRRYASLSSSGIGRPRNTSTLEASTWCASSFVALRARASWLANR